MRKYYYFCLVIFLCACSPINSLEEFNHEQAAILLQQYSYPQPTQQMIRISLPDKDYWRRIDLSYGSQGAPIMLVPQSESAGNWTESIRTQMIPYTRKPTMNMNKFAEAQLSAAQSDCQTVRPQIFNQTQQTMLLAMTIANCDTSQDQARIGKIFAGVDAVYYVYYSSLTGKIAPAQITRMQAVIENAQLVNNPSAR